MVGTYLNSLERISIFKVLFILLFCISEFFLINSKNPLSSNVAIAAIALSLLWDKDLPIVFYVSSSIMRIELGTFGNALSILIISVIALLSLTRNKDRSLKKYITAGCLFVPFALLSHFVGINSTFNATIVFIFSWLIVFYIAFIVKGKRQLNLLMSLFFTGVVLMVLQSLHPMSIIAEDNWFESKDVATAVAVIVYIALWIIINRKINILLKVVFLTLVIAGVVTIVLTYSRGVIIALTLSTVVLLFLGMRGNRRALLVGIVVVVSLAYVFASDIIIDYDRMGANLEGGNGRTDIWKFFYETMSKAGIFRLLFGCGPDGLTTLSQNATYAHSSILDYFFSYGVFGFAFISYILISVFLKIRKLNNSFYTGLFILNFFMFITHGNHSEPLFLYLLSLCMGAVCVNNSGQIYKKASTAIVN